VTLTSEGWRGLLDWKVDLGIEEVIVVGRLKVAFPLISDGQAFRA
jgi:hypothetical protein